MELIILFTSIQTFKNRVIVGELIEERHKAFSSFTFPNEVERDIAKEFIRTISIKNNLYSYKGKPLPFGYNDDGLLIVWEHNTPNNTLPIFWSSENGWFPLLKRKE